MYRSVRRFLTCVMLMTLTAAGTPAAADPAIERLGLPEALIFDGIAYRLAWSAEPAPGYIKQEYLPRGQDLQTWQNMLMVEFLAGKAAPADVAGVQAEALQARKASDPIVNFEMIRKRAADEVILDFVLSGADPAGGRIVEWNAYRYVRGTDRKGHAGVMLVAVSRRAYGDSDGERFLKDLAALRGKIRKSLAEMTLPR